MNITDAIIRVNFAINAKKRIIKKEIIDKAILEVINTINITEDRFLEIKDTLKSIMYQNSACNEERKKQVDTQLKKLQNRLLALYDDKIDGIISPEIYIKKRDDWGKIKLKI